MRQITTMAEAAKIQDFINKKQWHSLFSTLIERMDDREAFGFQEACRTISGLEGELFPSKAQEHMLRVAKNLINTWVTSSINDDGAYVPTSPNDPALAPVTSNPYEAMAAWFRQPQPLAGIDIAGFKRVAGALTTTLSFVEDNEVRQNGRKLAACITDLEFATSEEEMATAIATAKTIFETQIVPIYKALNNEPPNPITKALAPNSTKSDFMSLKGLIDERDYLMLKTFFSQGDTPAARVAGRKLLQKYK